MNWKVLLIAASIFLSGCATVSGPKTSFNYLPPLKNPIENKIIVDAPFDETWDELVSGLSETFYVINNIDKDSRLLNVSFSINDKPSLYTDCGITNRSFDFVGEIKTSSYEVADSSSYFSASGTPPNPNIFYNEVFRDTSLTGRSNIYVAPNDENSTTVSVNVRYSHSTKVSWDSYLYAVLYGTHNKINAPTQYMPAIDPVNFNTNSPLPSKVPADSYLCTSTGKFEKDIIDLVRNLSD